MADYLTIHPKVSTLTNHLLNHWLLGMKIAFVAVCLVFIFGGNHPPVYAQRNTPRVQTVITTEDAMQDDHIEALNKHIENTDAQLAVLIKKSDEQENKQSSWSGGITVGFTLLGLLGTGTIVLQFKQNKA
jgi:hypothetical protein